MVVRGVNEDEVVDFAALARQRDFQVRFIEYMPPRRRALLDPQEQVVPSAELKARIEERFELRLAPTSEPEPAVSYVFTDGAPGSVGFIPRSANRSAEPATGFA